MKSLLVTVTALWINLTVPYALAQGGAGEVGSGGGLAEQNITFAYLNLARYWDDALAFPGSNLTPSEKGLLRAMRDALPREYAATEQIKFASEKASPGFFLIEGAIRIAKTGTAVGSPIYFNVDLLYPGGVPLDLGTAVALLTHEMGHHHGVKEHAPLDLLGAKVHVVLAQETQTTKLTTGGVSLAVVNPPEGSGKPAQFILTDADKNHDITAEVLAGLSCPSSRSRVTGVSVRNLHGLVERFGPLGKYFWIRFGMDARVRCAGEGGKETPSQLRIRAGFSVSARAGAIRLSYDPATVKAWNRFVGVVSVEWRARWGQATLEDSETVVLGGRLWKEAGGFGVETLVTEMSLDGVTLLVQPRVSSGTGQEWDPIEVRAEWNRTVLRQALVHGRRFFFAVRITKPIGGEEPPP